MHDDQSDACERLRAGDGGTQGEGGVMLCEKGHNFEPRYSRTTSTPDWLVRAVLDGAKINSYTADLFKSTTDQYVCDLCKRCGKVIVLPQSSES